MQNRPPYGGYTPPPPPPPRDSREIVTEHAFQVAPELMGTPLARPWRRGAAMAVDGLLIAILANASSVLFALGAAYVLFRASASSQKQGYIRKGFRMMFRTAGAVALFVFALATWDNLFDRDDEDAPRHARAAALGADRVVADVQRQLRTAGLDDDDIREVLDAGATEADSPSLAAAIDSMAPAQVPAAYAAALERGDEAEAQRLRPMVLAAVAADTLGELHDEIADLREDNRDLAAALKQAREDPGLWAGLRDTIGELWLSFGWSGLYFTAFIALWSGQTPGKRAMGIRVIRLDGKPISWWIALERFGGYAASLGTLGLGFFQVFWDSNRMGIHDKIAETVVVRQK